MRTKLTAGFVKGFAPRKEREIAWDQTLPGFGLMVTGKGHRPLLQKCYSGGHLPMLYFLGRGGPDQGLVWRPG